MRQILSHEFNATPLDCVFLESGYSVPERSGRRTIKYEAVNSLVSSIFKAVVLKPAGLSGREVAYLRQETELSQDALGKLLGVDSQTVSLWERGRHAIPIAADVVFRRYSIEQRGRLFTTDRTLFRIEKLSEYASRQGDFVYVGRYVDGHWLFSYTVKAYSEVSAESEIDFGASLTSSSAENMVQFVRAATQQVLANLQGRAQEEAEPYPYKALVGGRLQGPAARVTSTSGLFITHH